MAKFLHQKTPELGNLSRRWAGWLPALPCHVMPPGSFSRACRALRSSSEDFFCFVRCFFDRSFDLSFSLAPVRYHQKKKNQHVHRFWWSCHPLLLLLLLLPPCSPAVSIMACCGCCCRNRSKEEKEKEREKDRCWIWWWRCFSSSSCNEFCGFLVSVLVVPFAFTLCSAAAASTLILGLWRF